jgi:hypothetical protein
MAPESEPLVINIGAAARLGVSIAAIGAGCLSILALADTWVRLQAQLINPTSEGIINLYGGLALEFKQFCPKYGNQTLPLGQPLVAPVQCLSQSLALDGSDGPNYNTTFNKLCIAALNITIAASVFIVFLALSAPSEKARRAWKNRHAMQAQGNGSEDGGNQQQLPSSFSLLLSAPTTIIGPDGRPMPQPPLGCFARFLSWIEIGHNNLVSALPLHMYLPLVALPCSLFLMVVSTLWIDGANRIGTDTIITTITGYTCATQCNDGYDTIPGPGAVAAVTASLLLIVASFYLFLRWAFPRCCPSLLEVAVDTKAAGISQKKRRGGYGSGAAGADDSNGGLDGGRTFRGDTEDDEDDGNYGRARNSVLGSDYEDEDDDDEEDQMFIPMGRSPIVTLTANGHNGGSSSSNRNSGSKVLSSLLPKISMIDRAISGAALVVKDDDDEENMAPSSSNATGADASAAGATAVGAALAAAATTSVSSAAPSSHLSAARRQALGGGVGVGGSISVLPLLLHRMSMSEAVLAGGGADDAVTSPQGTMGEGHSESLLGSANAVVSHPSDVASVAAAAPMSRSRLYHASARATSTGSNNLFLSPEERSWKDIEADKNPEVTYEHASVKMHPGAATVYRVIALLGIGLMCTAYGNDWWTFRFQDEVDIDAKGIKWYGGLAINSLTVRYPQRPGEFQKRAPSLAPGCTITFFDPLVTPAH